MLHAAMAMEMKKVREGESVSFVEGWEFMQTLGEGAYGE